MTTKERVFITNTYKEQRPVYIIAAKAAEFKGLEFRPAYTMDGRFLEDEYAVYAYPDQGDRFNAFMHAIDVIRNKIWEDLFRKGIYVHPMNKTRLYIGIPDAEAAKMNIYGKDVYYPGKYPDYPEPRLATNDG